MYLEFQDHPQKVEMSRQMALEENRGQRGHGQVPAPLQGRHVDPSVTAARTGSDRGGRAGKQSWRERPQGGRERDPQSTSLYKNPPLLLLPPLLRSSGEGWQPWSGSSLSDKVVEDTKGGKKALSGGCAGGLTQGQRRGRGDFLS